MDYNPLKDSMVSYFRDMYHSLGNISQRVMDALNPSSGLENRLAFAGISVFVQGNSPVDKVYGSMYLFSKERYRRKFDPNAGAYEGTNKRSHGNIGNNESIRWNDPNLNDSQRAKLILEAAGLKKSDPRHRRTSQPKKEDISWAKQRLGQR